MTNYFKISTVITIAVLAFFAFPVFSAQLADQVTISVVVTLNHCNNNGICNSPIENASNCFNDCGCNNNNICESQRGENISNCTIDCGAGSGGSGSSGGYILQQGLYIKNLTISNIMPNSVEISWQTNISASCVTSVGKTSEYEKEINSETAEFVGHLTDLIGLNPSTDYHFNIVCKSSNNLTAQTGDKYFTTPSSAKIQKPIIPVTPGTSPVPPVVSANKEITITIFNLTEGKVNLPEKDNKEIEVSPNTPISISANCNKITGAEKILVNLQSLKIESAKDSCEVSLVSPQTPGTYTIEVSIVDSKNTVIGKAEVELKVLGENKPFWIVGGVMLEIYILILAVIIFFVIIYKKRKKDQLKVKSLK